MKKYILVLILFPLFCNTIQSQNPNLQKGSVKQDVNKSDLVTQLDSLNFAYGLSWGDSIITTSKMIRQTSQ